VISTTEQMMAHYVAHCVANGGRPEELGRLEVAAGENP
jgi:hypothetical protein